MNINWQKSAFFAIFLMGVNGCAIRQNIKGPGETNINEKGGIPDNYKLVWADEFNNVGMPAKDKWQFDTSRNKEGWYNNELQYYAANRSKNVRIENGILTIEAHKEDLNQDDFPDWGGQKFTSGKITTDGIFSFTYGFVDVRAKLPCQTGSWPAIWTLFSDANLEWPDGGEIDIMEHTGIRSGEIVQTTHTKSYYHITNTQKSVSTKISDVCDSFHNYQLTWTEDFIKMGIDGQNYFSFRNDKSGNIANWPYFKPQYLILNLAIGGMFTKPAPVDENSLPWQFQIDYVRVYQK